MLALTSTFGRTPWSGAIITIGHLTRMSKSGLRGNELLTRREAQRFQLLCDLFPFSTDATVTILDVGAGYGPVSKFILDQFTNATCIAQDGSAPMLQRARQIMASYGARFQPYQSDLFDKNWLPQQFGSFDAAVSVSCLHNLRDFKRISEIYSDISTHLKPGGVFLNLDLVNAPTSALQQHYVRVTTLRRQREGPPAKTSPPCSSRRTRRHADRPMPSPLTSMSNWQRSGQRGSQTSIASGKICGKPCSAGTYRKRSCISHARPGVYGEIGGEHALVAVWTSPQE